MLETPEAVAACRRLNDELRGLLFDGPITGANRIVITNGVAEEGDDFVAAALAAVAQFDDFTPDNDPHGEHDFGALDVQGERLFFKIDYYDCDLTMHSPDPTDPNVTVRVLTIMLASEY